MFQEAHQVITEKELAKRLIARVETLVEMKPQDMPAARYLAARLAPFVMGIIRDELRAVKPKGDGA